MRIIYPPFVNHEGTFLTTEADLEGNVALHIKVKGKDGRITMTAAEAATLFKELKKMDVEALARIYA